jgi:AAHS family 4-hydroxybenzoate transporter-like MFS transporter
MDRMNPQRVLGFTYALGGVFLLGLSLVAHQYVLLVGFSFLIGFCFNGANTGMTALTTSFYPTAARATGASWMHGIGHVGAILSAFAGAEMLGMDWSFAQILAILALPALFAALAVLAVGVHQQRQMIKIPA